MLKYCEPLKEHFLKRLHDRFYNMIELNDNVKDFIIATVCRLKWKLHWIPPSLRNSKLQCIKNSINAIETVNNRILVTLSNNKVYNNE